ncbi:MAG: hypothetical protein GX610_10280, partial [Rhodococcus sp.]|nr:hypothetical protein [Rhodococcus sp. (in: high G+C Gram-positive bacteria)]
RGFLDELVDAALEDSVVTDDELDRLTRVATLLELPIQTVTSRTLAYRMTSGLLTLESGLRVCFTGDGAVDLNGRPVTREELEIACVTAGLEPVGSVTMKKCDLLVAVDPASLSGKAQNAHRYGTPIATAGAFLDALRHHRELSVVSVRSAGVASVCERCGDSWTASRRGRICKSCRTRSGTGRRHAAPRDTEQTAAVDPVQLITCVECSRPSELLQDQTLSDARCVNCC